MPTLYVVVANVTLPMLSVHQPPAADKLDAVMLPQETLPEPSVCRAWLPVQEAALLTASAFAVRPPVDFIPPLALSVPLKVEEPVTARAEEVAPVAERLRTEVMPLLETVKKVEVAVAV